MLITIATISGLVAHTTSTITSLPVGPNICGYFSGSADAPLTCPSPGACISYGAEPPNFGCDFGSGFQGYISECLDSGQAPNTLSRSGIFFPGNNILECGADFPFCSTVTLYGLSLVDGTTPSYLSYGCATQTGLAFTAYQGASPVSVSATSTSTTTTSSTSTQISNTTPSSTSTSSTAFVQSPGGLSTVADIGIGVGISVAALLVTVAIAVWFWRKRRRVASQSGPQYQPWASGNGTWYQDNTVQGKAELETSRGESRAHKFQGVNYSELSSERQRYELESTQPELE